MATPELPPRSFVIDTDTASDDAVAIAMALRDPDVRVAAIVTVAGNCPLEQATRNALYTAELSESDVPVFAGSSAPLEVDPAYATWFHGLDGMGDQGFPPPTRNATEGDGVEALIEVIEDNPGCVLVTLGPLTNVARALRRRPRLADTVDRCVVMGGTANSVGNVTPAAEFNLWFDPHAAREVFESNLPIEMVPWDVCRGKAGLDDADQRALRAIDSPLAHFFLDCNATALEAIRRQSGSTTLEPPDPTAMAVALDPDGIVVEASHDHVAIEVDGTNTRGMSVVDQLHVTGRAPTTNVVRRIETDRFKSMVLDAARPTRPRSDE